MMRNFVFHYSARKIVTVWEEEVGDIVWVDIHSVTVAVSSQAESASDLNRLNAKRSTFRPKILYEFEL